MSSNSRSTGLALMALAAAVFAGTNAQLLPALAFFPALIASLLGLVVFMKANRAATEEAEARTRRALNPTIRNKTMEKYAARQEETDGRVLQALGDREERRVAAEAAHVEQQVDRDELVLYEVDNSKDADAEKDDEGFVVTTDVSFPVEVQEQRSLADQLQKLERLRREGIINDDEFAIAKAKLLA